MNSDQIEENTIETNVNEASETLREGVNNNHDVDNNSEGVENGVNIQYEWTIVPQRYVENNNGVWTRILCIKLRRVVKIHNNN